MEEKPPPAPGYWHAALGEIWSMVFEKQMINKLC